MRWKTAPILPGSGCKHGWVGLSGLNLKQRLCRLQVLIRLFALRALLLSICQIIPLGGAQLLVVSYQLGQYLRMTASCDLIVFSDLDGTLIDHDTYDYTPAKSAIEAICRLSAGLVLASSKTAPEISSLRHDIGVEAWPAIVENGAGVLPPFVTACPDAGQYDAVRAGLAQVPAALRALFCGFGDVSVEGVVEMTGLSAEAAALAQQRSFSEPGTWSGTPAQKQAFLDALAAEGVTAQQGGRFLTLSLGHNKVDQMRAIIDTYEPRHTIALGDAPNDIAMLEFADLGIVVANPARAPLPPLKTEDAGGILRTTEPGPTGWNLAVLDAIARLELE